MASQRQNGHRTKRTARPLPSSKKSSLGKTGGGRKKRVIPTQRSIPAGLRDHQKEVGKVITYVLDTNVLMTDGRAIHNFREHEVCVVDQVWRELDNHKSGRLEINFQAREAIRTINKLSKGATTEELHKGIPLPTGGKLLLDFTKPTLPETNEINLTLEKPDDCIIMVCLSLKGQGKQVVLITNDGGCGVTARKAGIKVEEYLHEAALVETWEENIRTGTHFMPNNFLEDSVSASAKKGMVTLYELKHKLLQGVNPNEFLVMSDGLKLQVVSKPSSQKVVAETIPNFSHHPVWGIKPKNLEQELALQLLTDDRVRAVSLAGLSGSGKTLLALAAGLQQILDECKFSHIIFTRAVVNADKDIGFLPGTEEEKMLPWMGAMTDNMEVLTPNEEDKWGRAATNDFLWQKVRVHSLNFMRGRTFLNKYLIIDEAQNLTLKQLRLISTRVGEGSKIVFLGNIAQIDDNYLSENTNGLSIFIRSFADYEYSGHLTLQAGERSHFATAAEERLRS